MASTGAALFVLLVISLCAFSSASIDGRPRPKNFPDEPTVTYDGTPMLTDANGPVDCTWYGFANVLYGGDTTTSCLTVLRKALTNETVNPPASMKPYLYYTLKRFIDPANNQSYCYQGCFNLGGTAPPPMSADAPADAPTDETPPPMGADAPADAPTDAPPPVTFGVPPSSAFSPAPLLFPGAPPPGMDSAPLGAAVPPASIFPPPGAAPELSTPAPVATPPSPPAPVSPVGSSGAFLQPAALVFALVAIVAILVSA